MYVSLDSMAKAMAHSTWYKGTNAQNMLIYSEWAAVKAHDNGLILAETASEKLGKVANMPTVGIQMMDNWMNRLIWNACQCEIEKRTGLKFGTKENMIEAGKLHAEVGRMTQGNNARSELSAMQRSSNALAKMYSMFNSDGFKYISRLYEAAKRASAYKYLNKTNPGTISQQKVRSAHVFMAKAATAIIVSNLVYVLMGQLMKFALNKDREDEEGNEIFSVAYSEVGGSANKYGISFNTVGENGEAVLAVQVIVRDRATIKEDLAKQFREVLIYLPKIEVQAVAALEAMAVEIAELENNIEVIG